MICQQHLKNGREPLMETPGLIDWTKGLPAIKASGYEGWLAFETPHEDAGTVRGRGDEERGVCAEIFGVGACRAAAPLQRRSPGNLKHTHQTSGGRFQREYGASSLQRACPGDAGGDARLRG